MQMKELKSGSLKQKTAFKLTQPCWFHPNKEGAHYQWWAVAWLAPRNVGYVSKTVLLHLLPLSIVFSHAIEINKTHCRLIHKISP